MNEYLKNAARVEAERDRLLAAIVAHHAQRGDNRCWMDDRLLYHAAGLPVGDYDLVGSPSEMLQNCERFVTLRCSGGGPWKSYAELEVELKVVKAQVGDLERLNSELNLRIHRVTRQLTEINKDIEDVARRMGTQES